MSARTRWARGALVAALACSHESSMGPPAATISATSVAPKLDTLKWISEGLRVVAVSATAHGDTAGRYRWTVSDTGVLSGAPLADTLFVSARKEGAAFVLAVEQGGTRDSARIVVHQQIARTTVVPVYAYRSCPVQLRGTPVDSGGAAIEHPVTVTLASRDAALATVDAAGLLTPRAVGLDTILATAEGVVTATPFRIDSAPAFQVGNNPFATIVVGAGQFAVIMPRSPSPINAPVTLYLASSDAGLLRIVPQQTPVNLGYQVSPPIMLEGLAPGGPIARVTACDRVTDSVTLRVSTPRVMIVGAVPTGRRTDDPPWPVEVDLGDSLLVPHPVTAPFTLHAFATDSSVVHLDSAFYHVPAAGSKVVPVLSWPSHGTARVVFADSLGRYRPDTTHALTVVFPPLQLAVVTDTIALGMRQRVALALGVDRVVTDSPLTVLVANNNPLVATVTDTIRMPVGTTGGPPVVVTGRDTSGPASIAVTAYRHEPAGVTVRITRPQFGIALQLTGLPHYPGDAPTDVLVFANDSLSAVGPGLRVVTENVTATLASSDPSVASLDSTTLTIPAGSDASGVAHLSYNAPGTVTLTASDPRSAYYRYGAATSVAIQIVPRRLVFSDSVMLLGIGQFWSDGVSLEARIPNDLVVSLSHTSPAVAQLAKTVDTLPSTFPSGPVPLHGLAAGVDTVIATASGWIPDTLRVVVGLGTVTLAGWPATLAPGDSAPIYLEVRDQAGNGRIVDAATTFSLAPSANIAFDAGGTPITTITVPANGETSGYFYVKALAAGTGNVTITNANYQSYSNSLSVGP